MRKALLILLIFVGLFGCATTNLPPVTSSEFVFQDDEKRLWARSEEEQEALNKSGLVLKDKQLAAYLDRVARKLQPPKVYKTIPFKVIVLKNPYSNAFAYPNGVIYVHTGILSRIDNEAQLATLLAHEMTHATHRHQLREQRGIRNKGSLLASLGTLPVMGDLAASLGSIGAMAAVSGYSKQLETESDNVGIELVVKAGYNPREAPKLFEHLKAELEEENIKEPFVFGSHPKLQARIANYENFLQTNGKNARGVVNAKTYRKKVAAAIYENADLDLKAGRFSNAIRGTEKYLSIYPKSSKGHFLLGEIYRQKGEKGDLKKAMANYRKAIKLNSKYPDAHKGLGLIYLKQGNKKKAKKAFNSYLRLAPKAPDREYVKGYIAQCK